MSFLALLVALPLAQAWEGQPGLWLPGATPLAGSSGRFGAGVAWSDTQGESVLLKGIVGLGSRFALQGEGYVGGGRDPDVGLGLRYVALHNDGFSLAPYGLFEVGPGGTDSYLGLAGNFAGQSAAFDASLTLIGAHTSHGEGALVLPPRALAWLEAGITFYPAKHQEFRVGAVSRDDLQLAATYRWRGSWWYVEPSVLYWPGDLAARLQAGVRF